MHARLIVAGLVLAACAPAPVCAIGAHHPSREAFLWKVQRAGGPIVWLYGTIHDAGAEEVPDVAWRALESATVFASELGDDEPDRERVRELAQIQRGKGLDELLAPDDWWELANALRGTIKEDVLKRARPWLAMTQLTMHEVPPPQPPMDTALARRARARGIGVEHLESWEEQIVALDAAVKISDLADTIHQRHTIACTVERLRTAYDASDDRTLDTMLNVRGVATLLSVRNQRWLPQLERYLAGGGAFVAVGLGHMLGEAGLPRMLERAGYTVERTR